MIWLWRLFNLPLMMVLHAKHEQLLDKIETIQTALHLACGSETDNHLVELITKDLEKHLEEMFDLDARIRRLWDYDSKNA
jgi:hypothetical protein